MQQNVDKFLMWLAFLAESVYESLGFLSKMFKRTYLGFLAMLVNARTHFLLCHKTFINKSNVVGFLAIHRNMSKLPSQYMRRNYIFMLNHGWPSPKAEVKTEARAIRVNW